MDLDTVRPESLKEWLIIAAALLWIIKLLLDTYTTHIRGNPPPHKQYADKAATEIALERLAIRDAAVEKDARDRRAALHERIDVVAKSCSFMEGQIKTHLASNHPHPHSGRAE